MDLFKMIQLSRVKETTITIEQTNDQVQKESSIPLMTEEEDFNKHCEGYEFFPSILPAKRRIICIGDIHGDYNMTLACLKVAGVIDNDLNWIGDDTVVVQIGDQVDRCRPMLHRCEDPRATLNDEGSDIKIMKLFTELHKKAIAVNPEAGVYSLLGNHELMNVLGNMNYVSYEGLEEFKDYKDPENPSLKFSTGKEARIHAFAPGNEYAKFMGCTRLSAMIIGSNIFVHAGIIPEFLEKTKIKGRDSIKTINSGVRRWLLGKIDKNNVADIVNSSNSTMFWTRVLGSIPPGVNNEDPDCEKYLKPVLKLLRVGHMMVGHTPQFYANKEGINASCGNALWRVDNGSSKAFDKFDMSVESEGTKMRNRKVQVLEILNDKKFKILKTE